MGNNNYKKILMKYSIIIAALLGLVSCNEVQ